MRFVSNIACSSPLLSIDLFIQYLFRINAIEAELKQTETTNGQMKKDVKQLKEKLEDVDIQLNESQIRCNYLAEDNEKLLEQLRLQREELEAEKRANTQVGERSAERCVHRCGLVGRTFEVRIIT